MSTGAIFNKNQNGRSHIFGQTGSVLPVDPQFRSLLQYIEGGKTTLDDIRDDFYMSQSNPGDPSILHKAAKKLAGFCSDTDGWGFEKLYKVAFGLQILLVDSLNRAHNDCFWEALGQGLAMLSDLLNQCESDYRQRLTLAGMLDHFQEAAC